jgi:group I intron endonuclease
MSISAIYKIQSQINPKRYYIGSAINIKTRWTTHLNLLLNGRHHSPQLQRHYDKYGIDDLVFIIIEPCFPEFLTIREQYYMNKLKPYFNCAPMAGSSLGIKRSLETRQKQSKLKKGNYIPWNKGRTGVYSKEILKNMSDVKKGKKMREEVRLKMIGKRPSEETKSKMRKSQKIRRMLKLKIA